MTIYVDKPIKYATKLFKGRAKWCHLWTDGDIEELHNFASNLGLKKSWFQDHNILPHYDIVLSKRKLALKLGAVEKSLARGGIVTDPNVLLFGNNE